MTSRVPLPAGAEPPYTVYVNGVPQVEGVDYRVEPGALLFDREMAREERLGLWRWTLIFLGIAGVYGKNDSVDLTYRRDGRELLASGLAIEHDDG